LLRELRKAVKHNRAATANRRFEFDKRRQLFIRTHNKTLSIAAVRIGNPDPVSFQSIGGYKPPFAVP
jgi:hypothetical protein